jgi:hypothetical protein
MIGADAAGMVGRQHDVVEFFRRVFKVDKGFTVVRRDAGVLEVVVG